MALTAEEQSKVMRHLGFAEVEGYTSAAGPVVIQYAVRTNAEAQMARLTSNGETRARSILTSLDAIEVRMVKATKRLAVTQLGRIAIRQDELKALEAEYRRWGWRLAECLGCEPNRLAQRYSGSGVCAARVP